MTNTRQLEIDSCTSIGHSLCVSHVCKLYPVQGDITLALLQCRNIQKRWHHISSVVKHAYSKPWLNCGIYLCLSVKPNVTP